MGCRQIYIYIICIYIYILYKTSNAFKCHILGLNTQIDPPIHELCLCSPGSQQVFKGFDMFWSLDIVSQINLLLVAILVQQGHDNSSHARQLRPVAGQFRGGWEEKWWVTVGNGNIVVIMSPAMVMAMQRSCCYGKGYQRCEDGEWYGCFGCRPLWTFVCPYPSKRFQDVPRKAVNEGIDFIGQGWAAGTASNKAKNCWVSWRQPDVIGAGSSVQRLVHQTTSRFSRWTWHIWLQNIFERYYYYYYHMIIYDVICNIYIYMYIYIYLCTIYCIYIHAYIYTHNHMHLQIIQGEGTSAVRQPGMWTEASQGLLWSCLQPCRRQIRNGRCICRDLSRWAS